ncbi:riboflavin biosynthesis protein RibF [Jeotgalibaca caeni]|uniref:riboflavin biosynthesis protein RibF n=1 Tax=Jeotgalibaca caeni TaxID=3028623 RepID=UPI00237ECAD9|nr:riboflavin biosynthesis protein RibF [Jeotgalibaca caeni]MDE1549056.1 riboflavin biosynthesis protein RibF [Jeotgalibaca caeni]
MEIIYLHHPYQEEEIPNEEIVLALGYFDGVHTGHQAVIRAAKKEAEQRNCKLAVMTFNQHPSIVYKKLDAESMKYLSILDRKIELMEALEVDYFYVIDFTYDFGTLRPQEFVDQYIVGLHAKAIVAGFDYTYGPKTIADMAHLPTYAKKRFDIIEISPQVAENKEKISSTSIRQALDDGDMQKANRMLGYLYQFEGRVMHGDARGRELGYPTANIKVGKQIRLPKTGVYVVSIEVQGKWYQGMASIGYNITFEENRDKTVEVNIFDFDRMIYGEKVKVRWHHFLRDEWKFSSAQELITQLEKDAVDTKSYFMAHPEEMMNEAID